MKEFSGGGPHAHIMEAIRNPFKWTSRMAGKITNFTKISFTKPGKYCLVTYAKLPLPYSKSLWGQVHELIQGSIYSPDTTIYSRIKSMCKGFPTLQIINNVQYYMSATGYVNKGEGNPMGKNDICVQKIRTESKGTQNKNKCLDEGKSINKGLEKVFGVQFKLMIIKDANGIFLLADKVYNYLTSTKYTALTSAGQPNQKNCSAWVVDFFAGVLQMQTAGGELCTPGNWVANDLAKSSQCPSETPTNSSNGVPFVGGAKGRKSRRKKKRKKGKKTTLKYR